MNKSLVITSVIIFFITFLLILGVFIFTMFNVSYDNEELTYYFTIPFDEISIYQYQDYSDLPENAFGYINYNNKSCLYIYLDTKLVDDKYYTFTLNNPYLILIYDISEQGNFVDDLSIKYYLFEGNSLHLSRSNLLYGGLVPYHLLPYWEGGGNYSSNYHDYILNYYNENEKLPFLYNVYFIDVDAYLIYQTSSDKFIFSYSVPEYKKPSIYVSLDTYSIFSSATYVFSENIEILDFPTFEWKFNSILDIGSLFNSLIKYIGDLGSYFTNLASSLFYSFLPFFWVD